MIQLLAGTPELGKLSDEPGEILGYPFRGTCVGVGLAYLVAGARRPARTSVVNPIAIRFWTAR
jgi:hypothetical protein